jgi:hypothetical protein
MRSIKLAAVFTLLCASLGWMPARAVAPPAEFQAGFAVRTINPVKPQALGGFGYDGDSPTNVVHDPMQVRAMAIRQGNTIVEMAIVDTQGYFSGYQEGAFGSYDARKAVASQLAAELNNPNIGTQNIIVSSTHSHAAPTIMGIWGKTDPDYLKAVYEGTVGALLDAAHSMRRANLYAAKADVRTINVWGVSQTDGYQGWTPDFDLPLLWARDPATGGTLGLYANVPSHADIVEGSALNEISADHIGVERSLLDGLLGGTSVVAMGTLGRQESIVQVKGYAHADALGRYVTNEILRALSRARPITDATLAAAEQYVLLPGTNPALAALNFGNAAGSSCLPGADICTIDRAITPPFAAGDTFGTWFTALRIGDVVYATEPGEAFSEVSAGIKATMGAPDVRVVGMAQDQLGYYFPPESLPFAAAGNAGDLAGLPLPNHNDHFIYNASAFLGEANVQAHAVNAALLGFTPVPTHQGNEYDDVSMSTAPGVQTFPLARESANRTFTFDARWSGAAIGGAGTNGPISWDWGDGTTSTSGQYFVEHTFPESGVYQVRARIPEGAQWFQRIYVDDPLSAHVTTDPNGRIGVAIDGGQGTIVSARWSYEDGSVVVTDGAHGVPDDGRHGTVTVLDGAGNTDAVSF